MVQINNQKFDSQAFYCSCFYFKKLNIVFEKIPTLFPKFVVLLITRMIKMVLEHLYC